MYYRFGHVRYSRLRNTRVVSNNIDFKVTKDVSQLIVSIVLPNGIYAVKSKFSRKYDAMDECGKLVGLIMSNEVFRKVRSLLKSYIKVKMIVHNDDCFNDGYRKEKTVEQKHKNKPLSHIYPNKR